MRTKQLNHTDHTDQHDVLPFQCQQSAVCHIAGLYPPPPRLAMDADGKSYMVAMSPTMRTDILPSSQQNSPWVAVGSTKTQENIIHKKSFSRTAASLFAATLLVAPSAYAKQPEIDLDNLTAAKAAADFCAGKVTIEAMVTAALSRAKAFAELNAFITLDGE